MGRLPSVRKLMREDFKDAPEWVDRMFYAINNFQETVFSAFDKNINIDNLQSFVKTVEFTTKTTYGTAPLIDQWEAQKFANNLSVRPTCVLLGRIENLTSNKPITSAVTIDWSYSGSTISINYITGLEAEKKYRLTLLIS